MKNKKFIYAYKPFLYTNFVNVFYAPLKISKDPSLEGLTLELQKSSSLLDQFLLFFLFCTFILITLKNIFSDLLMVKKY